MESNDAKPSGGSSRLLSPSLPPVSTLSLRNRHPPDEIKRHSRQSKEEFEKMVQRAVQSSAVQDVFPELLSFEKTHNFKSYFLTQPVSTECRKVRNTFIDFAITLDRYERKADCWKQGVSIPSKIHHIRLTRRT
jgi:hypothetical protein